MWFLLFSQFTLYSLLGGTKGTIATLSAKQRAGVLLKSVARKRQSEPSGETGMQYEHLQYIATKDQSSDLQLDEERKQKNKL